MTVRAFRRLYIIWNVIRLYNMWLSAHGELCEPQTNVLNEGSLWNNNFDQ